MSKMTAQVAAIDKNCSAASTSPISAKANCTRKKWVIVIDPGHGGAKNVNGSYANNAVGAVSDVLEKTMTQRFANILKPTIEARAKTLAVDVEVLLTKSDENKNLTAKERAKVATDAKADFFIILHFNGMGGGNVFTAHNLTPIRNKDGDIIEHANVMDITPGIKEQRRNQPAGYKRRLISDNVLGLRGPLLVKRKDMPKGNAYVTSDAFGESVKNNVVAALKRLDSASSIKAHGDVLKTGDDVPVLKPKFYVGFQLACCYLESDFISVESGDRTWNPEEYAANIGKVRGEVDLKAVGASVGKTLGGANGATLGAALGPVGIALGAATAAEGGEKTGAAVGQGIGSMRNAFKDPTLLPKDAMYQAASEGIADAIFGVILRASIEEWLKGMQEPWKKFKDWWKK